MTDLEKQEKWIKARMMSGVSARMSGMDTFQLSRLERAAERIAEGETWPEENHVRPD